MASETVEQVYADVAERVKVARSLGEDSVIHNSAVADLLANINERYMAAHKREIDRIRAERDEWQKQALEENAALDVARAELTAKDEEIQNSRKLLGSMLERCLQKCVNCEDVCDDCDCNAADIVPLVKLVLAGEAINLDDYCLTPLVKFAKNKDALDAKDAEIARLKRENFDLNGCLLTEQELAEKRDALIRSLADALNSYLIGECIDCGKRCEGDDVCDHQKNLRALVKKAREVAK